jgi:hypothetical protein
MRNDHLPSCEAAVRLISPWSLRAWPPIVWQPGHSADLRLEHLGTRVTVHEEAQQITAGQTIWGGDALEGEAGMAWDWVQMPLGMVAMADPMCVITNLRILGDEGQVLTAFQAARILNAMVYSLPWQTEVQRAIRDFH